jgi:hypothetical protein
MSTTEQLRAIRLEVARSFRCGRDDEARLLLEQLSETERLGVLEGLDDCGLVQNWGMDR